MTTEPLPQPKTLIEAIRYFADPDITLRTMVELRWPNGVCCPTCGRADPRFIATRRLWECKEKHPRRQFSAKVGTIFEDSPIDLGKWFAAIWMVANCKNGISSYEMHRALGVTQKTAWFMESCRPWHRGARQRAAIDAHQLHPNPERPPQHVPARSPRGR